MVSNGIYIYASSYDVENVSSELISCITSEYIKSRYKGRSIPD